jgi:hypothetical protein
MKNLKLKDTKLLTKYLNRWIKSRMERTEKIMRTFESGIIESTQPKQ